MRTDGPTRAQAQALRTVWDIALFTVGFFVTTLGLLNVPGTEDPEGLTNLGGLVWLASVVAWVSVFFRRTRPVLVGVAGLVLAIVGSEYLLMLIGAHHAALAWRGRARVWLGAGAGGVVLLFWAREALTPWGDRAALTADSGPASAVIVSGVIAAASVGVALALTLLAASRRVADGQRARADAERSRATQLGDELARQEERSRIAREIHDGLTNRLALVSMMGGNVASAVRDGDPSAADLAKDLQSEARHALVDLRALVGDLRTEPSAPPARETSMRSLGDLISATRAAGTKLDAIVVLDGAAGAHPALDGAVFRLVQEALTNAVKHAPSQTVSLYLDAGPGAGVRLRVANALEHVSGDATSGGSGLTGMRERVAALQGTAWTGEHDGEFIVDITLPWLSSEDPGRAEGIAAASPLGVNP